MNILIVADAENNRLIQSYMEIITLAGKLRNNGPGSIFICFHGTDVSDEAEEAVRLSGCDVIALQGDHLEFHNPEAMKDVIPGLAEELECEYVCFPHSIYSCQVAAATALSLNASCITAVESYRQEKEGTSFHRSIFNGKITIDLLPCTSRKVLTVLPGSFPAGRGTGPGKTYSVRKIKAGDTGYHPVTILAPSEADSSLEEAEVIISAGRGIGNKENLNIMRDFAQLFSMSAVGASRIVCDNDWIPYSHQVGITGKTVAPGLYVACGISGSQQHIAGMKGSRFIISINSDPKAQIFAISDFCIVEDLTTFIPLVIEKYHEIYGQEHKKH